MASSSGAVTLTRFYGIHVWVLPAALIALVAFHLFGVIRQGIAASPRRHPLTEPQPGESRRDAYEREYAAEKAAGKPFWEALYKDAVVALAVVVIVVVVALVLGAPLDEPANPNATNYVPRPEWYFMDLFQLLWYFGGSLEPLIIFGLFTLGALIFLAVPFLDRGRARHPRQRHWAMGLAAIVVGAVLFLTMMGLTSSSTSVAVVAAREGMTVNQLRGLEVFNRQGCAACHAIDGVGGSNGPGLSRAGTRYELSDMRQQILDPDDPTKMPAYPRLSQAEPGRPARVSRQPGVRSGGTDGGHAGAARATTKRVESGSVEYWQPCAPPVQRKCRPRSAGGRGGQHVDSALATGDVLRDCRSTIDRDPTRPRQEVGHLSGITKPCAELTSPGEGRA